MALQERDFYYNKPFVGGYQREDTQDLHHTLFADCGRLHATQNSPQENSIRFARSAGCAQTGLASTLVDSSLDNAHDRGGRSAGSLVVRQSIAQAARCECRAWLAELGRTLRNRQRNHRDRKESCVPPARAV